MLSDFADVFALSEEELGTTNVVQHSVDTGDSAPLKQPPRRVPYSMRGKVAELVNTMLECGSPQVVHGPVQLCSCPTVMEAPGFAWTIVD